ncbi:MAG: PEP-CTERM sorting domain-containing protein [Akkermansiaceae bacterium]
MKPITTLATILLLTCHASAAISYSYSYDLMPRFSGSGAIYADDLHSGPANTYDATGDLNDGIVYAGSNPVDSPATSSMVAWNPAPGTPATITVDLGALYNLTSVELTTYAFTAFALGHPDDVTITTSADDITYAGSALHIMDTSSNGAILQSITRTDSGVRYIKLAFDGDTHDSNDKYGLTELAIEGTPVPEPSSSALLGLAGLAIILRRRK